MAFLFFVFNERRMYMMVFNEVICFVLIPTYIFKCSVIEAVSEMFSLFFIDKISYNFIFILYKFSFFGRVNVSKREF
jgi:hypothetical protein